MMYHRKLVRFTEHFELNISIFFAHDIDRTKVVPEDVCVHTFCEAQEFGQVVRMGDAHEKVLLLLYLQVPGSGQLFPLVLEVGLLRGTDVGLEGCSHLLVDLQCRGLDALDEGGQLGLGSRIFYVIWIPLLSILRQAFRKLGDII